MDIKFTGTFASITPFELNNLPNFVVITGINGSGKSQFLQLLNNLFREDITPKDASISNRFKFHDIVYKKSDWNISNTSPLSLDKIKQDTLVLYNYFTGKSGTGHVNIPERFGGLTKTKEVFEKIITKTGKTKTTISLNEFEKTLPEFILGSQDGLIMQHISEIFLKYKINQLQQILYKEKNEENKYKDLGVPPWERLREMFKLANLPYDINEPTNEILDNYQLILIHKIYGIEIPFQNLSSGEKIIMTLTGYLFSSEKFNEHPKIFLLDEPDAHLHPSLIPYFMKVLKELFVDTYGIKIFMTTHSPSTVVFAPLDSLYEMFLEGDRIRRVENKNDSIFRLTAGLVFIGEGTKYIFVEAEADRKFYSYIHDELVRQKKILNDIPLLFIDSKNKDKTGCKSVVYDLINRINSIELNSQIKGLIDLDSGNKPAQGIQIIPRFSIENYLADPIVTYVAMLNKKMNVAIKGLDILFGEEEKIKNLTSEQLQLIANFISARLKGNISQLEMDDKEMVTIEYISGQKIVFPKWISIKRGKDILPKYSSVLGKEIHFGSLFESLQRLKMFPIEFVKLFNIIKYD